MIDETRVCEVERRLNELLARIARMEKIASELMDRINTASGMLNNAGRR
jgi:hypothetical protein